MNGVYCCPLCFLILDDKAHWDAHRERTHPTDKWLDTVEPKHDD